jgi:hypothetical protein
MSLEKRNLIIVGIVAGFLIMIAVVIGFLFKNNASNTETGVDVYKDPASGETIITDNKSPQISPEALKNTIIYPGFSKLLDRGLSTTEIQSIQATIAEYSLDNEKQFKEVSLVVDSMRYSQPSDSVEKSSLTFSLKVNRKDDYYMTVTPTDSQVSIARLYAADKKTLLIER